MTKRKTISGDELSRTVSRVVGKTARKAVEPRHFSGTAGEAERELEEARRDALRNPMDGIGQMVYGEEAGALAAMAAPTAATQIVGAVAHPTEPGEFIPEWKEDAGGELTTVSNTASIALTLTDNDITADIVDEYVHDLIHGHIDAGRNIVVTPDDITDTTEIATTSDYTFLDESAGSTPAATTSRLLVGRGTPDFQAIRLETDDGHRYNLIRDTVTIVKNVTGVTIPKGSVVYHVGISDVVPTIALAQADAQSTSTVFGIVTDNDIVNDGFGLVVKYGAATFDTSAMTGFQFLSASSAGALTDTPPIAPDRIIRIGRVISVGATGSFFVDVQTGEREHLTTKGDLQGYSTEPGRIPVGDDGQILVADSAATFGVDWIDDVKTIAVVIDGGGAEITDGLKFMVPVGFKGTITANRIYADQTGDIVLDVWKDTYANYPPDVADTITASAKPTITAGVKSEDTTLTGWTVDFSAGDVFAINVDSCTDIQLVTFELVAKRRA